MRSMNGEGRKHHGTAAAALSFMGFNGKTEAPRDGTQSATLNNQVDKPKSKYIYAWDFHENNKYHVIFWLSVIHVRDRIRSRGPNIPRKADSTSPCSFPPWMMEEPLDAGTEGLSLLEEGRGKAPLSPAGDPPGSANGAPAGEPAWLLPTTFTSSFIPPRQYNLFPAMKYQGPALVRGIEVLPFENVWRAFVVEQLSKLSLFTSSTLLDDEYWNTAQIMNEGKKEGRTINRDSHSWYPPSDPL